MRERKAFQRTFDLTERVIPEEWRREALPRAAAVKELLLLALSGHGWAQTGTLASTWRLSQHAVGDRGGPGGAGGGGEGGALRL